MTKPRLILLRPFRERDRTYIQTALGRTFEIFEPVDFEDSTLAASIQGMDAAIGVGLTPAVLAAADQLKLLQTPGAGFDGADLAALSQRGIMVANSHSNAPFVAEHAMGMLLALFKRLLPNDRALRTGFLPIGQDSFPASLFGSTIGLLGLGHVGQALLRLLVPWGVSVVSAVRRPERYSPICAQHKELSLTSVEGVLERADAVVVSLPLTPHTRGLLDCDRLPLLRAGTILINVGRAEVIDRRALFQALTSGQLAGVGLDVWWSDRPELDAVEFARFDQVIMSPHRAGSDAQNSPHLYGVVANLLEFARTGRPIDLVDVAREY